MKGWFRRRKKRKEKKEEASGRGDVPEAAVTQENVFAKFLPTELLARMGVQEVSLKPSDLLTEPKELQAVILNANIAGFQELIHNTQIKEVYRLINKTLSFCIPVIYGNHGMIDHFCEAGVTALFSGQAEDGLNAAVLICEEVIKQRDWETYGKFAVGLCYGTVMAGVVGDSRRLSVLTLSTYTGLGDFLQKQCPKYYARILAAGSFLKKADGFEKKYNHRFLGLFYIRDTKSTEEIYDIFDGDEAGIRNRKRKTKILFEKGVGFFLGREFVKARGYFIEVLKADREDKAAREYIFRCDTLSSMAAEQAASADVFLESF